jgi:hypothetical protein
MIQLGSASSRIKTQTARSLRKGIEMTKGKLFLWAASAAFAVVALLPADGFSQSTQFYPLTPCRVIDTRNVSAPILTGQQTRSFSVKGVCGIPADATAISYNLTAISGTLAGFMTLFPHGIPRPQAAAVTFLAGAVIGNGGVVGIAAGSPDLSIFLNVGQAHAAVDVTGYFK